MQGVDIKAMLGAFGTSKDACRCAKARWDRFTLDVDT